MEAIATVSWPARSRPWQTSSHLTYKSGSVAADVSLAQLGLPIIRGDASVRRVRLRQLVQYGARRRALGVGPLGSATQWRDCRRHDHRRDRHDGRNRNLRAERRQYGPGLVLPLRYMEGRPPERVRRVTRDRPSTGRKPRRS